MRCIDRCPTCPHRETNDRPVISGKWPEPNRERILFVSEYPDSLVGRAAQEFDSTYLPLSGLYRDQVWTTGAVKCTMEDEASPEQVKGCAEFHLRRELDQHKPAIIVLMGAAANKLYNLDVELEHGMIHHGSLLGWTGTVFSTFSPALGLHKSDKMLAMADKLDGDFPRLRLALRGQLKPLVDNLATKFERVRDAKRIRRILRSGIEDGHNIAVDTESKKSWRGFPSTIKWDPWCATFAIRPGEAFMVRTTDEDAFREFLEQLLRYWRAIFHNMPYDFGILEMVATALNIRGFDGLWRNSYDTMQMAYDDGRLPKGLKALGYRLLGKRMTSFDETVVPHSRDRALDYFERAMMESWPVREQEWTGDWIKRNCSECKGTGKISNGLRGKMRKTYPCDCEAGKVTVKKMTRKHGLTEKMNLLASGMTKKTDIDLWQRWEDWCDNDPVGMQIMIDRIGPLPLPSIEYVPEDQAIEYACGDAHETLRIFPIIQERLVNLRRSITV